MSDHCSIVVLNYKGPEDSMECVDSILNQVKGDFTVILVDNCSQDESRAMFEQKKKSEKSWKNVVLLYSDENRGFSSGNNIGIRHGLNELKSNYFWILNNDTVLKNNALEPLIRMSVELKSPAIIGSTLLFYDQPDRIQALGGRLNPWKGRIHQVGFNQMHEKIDSLDIENLDYAVGASLFVSKAFIDEVGLLSEDYFLFFEEVDWSIRAKKRGIETRVCLESLVYHKQGSATKNKVKGSKNIKMMYFQFKNLILLYKKYFPGLIVIPYLVVSYRCFKFAIKQDRRFLDLWVEVVFRKRKPHFGNK